MRLNKYISSCGVCSRREADKLIAEGRITVNGELPSPGQDVSETDTVCLDGTEIEVKEKHSYLAYYKPVGVVCTTRDSHAEKTVIDDLGFSDRVTYAGRLDKESEGLLIMTDDGDLIQAMMKGSNKHEKEYEVTVNKDINGDFLKKMSLGVYLKDLDRTTRPCTVKRTGTRSFNIILTQGLNRQIRRMCHELGYEVVSLKRIRVMCVELKNHNLKAGEYESLTDEEVAKLYRDTKLGEKNGNRRDKKGV
jgi:23S rRNA pseudouridine2604 synthase